MNIWQEEDWHLNHRTLNEIFPFIQAGLQKYINKDIVIKILSIIYYNDIFNSPVRPKRPPPTIPKAPSRPTAVRRRINLS
tara:strand:+ start:143 stop:382 length:240 start_codon:yes stop_codon:yes gene_type:complete